MKPHHSDRARLLHVRDAIRQIGIYLEEDPARGDRTRDAVIRQLEIIGEASNHISREIRARYPQVPWKLVIGMRHHISHGYFELEMKDVWDTVDNDLESLHDAVLLMLDDPAIV